MLKIYENNWLLFRTQKDIELREFFVKNISEQLKHFLKTINHSFDFQRVEASQLTPIDLLNENYTEDDYYKVDDLALRPETTMGSFAYADHILNPHNKPKTRLPIVVRQAGKSFRREQDKVLKHMRLKEFYQLEFQVIYSNTTADDYYGRIVEYIDLLLSSLVWDTRLEPSDRLPSYSEITTDVIMEWNDMEICSISKRKDYHDDIVTEVAIGLDRLVYNYNCILWETL